MRNVGRKLTLVSIAAAAGLIVPAAGVADAATPEKGPVEVLPYEFSADCSPYGFAFENNVQGQESLWVETFFDAQGNPVRQVTHDSFVETDTNSVSGFSLRASGRRTDTLDVVAGTRTVVGKSFLMTAPGSGDVVHDVGRVVFDAPFHVSFEAGRHDDLHGLTNELVCAALAAG
jgi:hypothetical protein